MANNSSSTEVLRVYILSLNGVQCTTSKDGVSAAATDVQKVNISACVGFRCPPSHPSVLQYHPLNILHYSIVIMVVIIVCLQFIQMRFLCHALIEDILILSCIGITNKNKIDMYHYCKATA